MRQSGFTLIELLLVLAIIGIISAIAIPALLSQRARARDKACITSTVGHLGDIVGQYDMAKEDQGNNAAGITNAIRNYLTRTVTDRDPWDSTVTALNPSPFQISGNLTKSDFEGNMNPSPFLGRGRAYIQFASSAQPGFIGVIVRVQLQQNGDTLVKKTAAVE